MSSQEEPLLSPSSVPAGRDHHELVRQTNVAAVFAVISARAPVTRGTVMQLTGLSKPTVLRLVAALEEEGLIRRATGAQPERRGAGRIPIAYEPNPDAAYVIGVDVGGTEIVAGLADLRGQMKAEITAPTEANGGELLVEQVAGLARALSRDASIPLNQVASMTIGVPGVENPDGTIRLAPAVPGLDRTAFGQLIGAALDVPVQIENDVNLAALGELENGAARNCRTFALLALGSGVGMGLVVDGQLTRGTRGGAGEVAFLPIGYDPASAEARRRGAFELAVSSSGLSTMLARHLDHEPQTTDGVPTPAPPQGSSALHLGSSALHLGSSALPLGSSADEIYEEAGRGDPLALSLIDTQAALVARAILTIACLIDPELVVLGGSIGSNPLLLGPVAAAVERITPWPVRVESSILGSRAGMIGAIHHALRSVPQLEAAAVSARMRSRGHRSGREPG